MNDNKEVKAQRMFATDGRPLTENTYNLAIGGTLIWGVLLNILMAVFLTPVIMQMNFLAMIVIYLAGSFACTYLVYRGGTPAASFAGFSGLALCMGLLLTYFISFYDGSTVYSAFLMTGIVVVVMMIAATLFPAFFLSMGRVLGISLLTAIVVELIGSFLFRNVMSVMDYVVVLIFCGYIGYDWAKAQAYPKTLDNAIASAADIYVDVVNIFIRILEITGNNRRR